MTATTRATEFDRLDADDEPTVTDWLDMVVAAAETDTTDAAPPCAIDLVGSLRFAPPDTELEDWVVRADGRVVASVRLAFPDGAPVARVDQLLVRPDRRRQGIGTSLYRHALARAVARGRTELMTTLVESLPDRSDVDPGPGVFATALGASRGTGTPGIHQWLDLTQHDPLAGGVPEPAAGYRLESWGTTTPDRFVLPVSALEASLGADTDEADDADAIRASFVRRFETMRIGRGRRAYQTGVVHEASGRLVGFTSISKTTGNPGHALQGMTVVHRDHRGHRLGMVAKLANLAHLLHHEPAVRRLETANAADNSAMLAVNAAMGFRHTVRWFTWRAAVDQPSAQSTGSAASP